VSAERLLPLALVTIALAEVIAAAAWWEVYYRRGLLLFRHQAPLIGPNWHAPTIGALESHFKLGVGPTLTFRTLSGGEIAFRARVFELRLLSYTPVMHGLLRVDPWSRAVVVEGRANWFILAFVAGVVTVMSRQVPVWEFLPFPLLGLGAIYIAQARQYARVARVAAGEAVSVEPATSAAGNRLAWLLLAALVAVVALMWIVDYL
jgi:hypothetical protein